MNSVKNFTDKFHVSSSVEEVFSSDCSYWFAMILYRRFIRDNAKIVYDKAKNHFATQIHDRVYDITGDVTDNHEWAPWLDITDESLIDKVTRESIMF